MATFAKSSFNAASYASFRPTYPSSLFSFIYAYHAQSGRAGWEKVVDLGCGTGQATLEIANQFKQTVGCDPSKGMIENAQLSAQQSKLEQKPTFVVSSAENLSFLEDNSVDMAIAAQAAHWFDYKTLFPELGRVLKPGGTVAFWNYNELRFGGRPALDQLVTRYSHDEKSLGPHWQQPGRSILEGYLQRIPTPTDAPWDPASNRRVYFVGDHEPELQGEKHPVILKKYLSWANFSQYLRTWSSLHDYLDKHPEDKDSSGGDISDRFVREVREAGEKIPEADAKAWEDGFEAEWPLALYLLRRRLD
ncbi:Trans-aconitate 3-methyltransferase [Ceratobasidium theobromae]|uniref:Trans-aconitate 3-methyltransferase n=1 Tax=Ceratobasidium theobromae TaxID=1582974 RepID=A0A5N5QXN6_9AGAM|nr:Trans-aconitate 3-methyltransferase [Ceratobasidium theobromae]